MIDWQDKNALWREVRALDIPFAAKLVFEALLEHLNNETGQCFPSRERLMKACGMGRTTVRDALDVLKRKGLIECHSGGGTRSTRYRFPRLGYRVEIRPGTDFDPGRESELRGVEIRPEGGRNPTPNKESNLEGNKEDICPKPAKPVRTRNRYPDDFEAFWTAYPTDSLMSKSEAGKAWSKLTENDRASAIAAIPGFVSHCRENTDYRPVHAVRFLSQRRFEGFNAAQPSRGDEDDPVLEFPGGFKRRRSFVIKAIEAWRENPRSWPASELSAPPDSPSCRVPRDLLKNTGVPEPSFKFGNQVPTPYSLIRMVVSKGSWLGEWGPEPGKKDSLMSPEQLAEIMGEGFVNAR